MKELIRRHARQIAGVSGAALLLTAVSILMTGTERVPVLEPLAVSIPSASPLPIHDGLAGPSFTPSPSPSASASPAPSATALPFTEIDGVPEAATVDQVNTAIGLAIGAILLALVAAGLAGVAIARQPAGGGGDEDYVPQDEAPGDGPPEPEPAAQPKA